MTLNIQKQPITLILKQVNVAIYPLLCINKLFLKFNLRISRRVFHVCPKQIPVCKTNMIAFGEASLANGIVIIWLSKFHRQIVLKQMTNSISLSHVIAIVH